jgi:hypothetical protein
MPKIKIFIADLTNQEQVENLEYCVNNLKAAYLKIKVTYLQSSAVTGDKVGEVSAVHAQHVLTAIAEWDDEIVARAEGGSASGPVLAQRTGRGKAYR